MSETLAFAATPIATTRGTTSFRTSTFSCHEKCLNLQGQFVKRHQQARMPRDEGRNRRGRNDIVHATAAPIEVTSDTFEKEVLSCDVPVVVDFYAAWCGPCKLMTPLMDWAASEYEGKIKVVKVDTEENDGFVKTYAIYGLPTFAVFVNGEAKGVQEGAMSKAVLKQYIEEHASL